MTRVEKLSPEFVRAIPQKLEAGVLYVSIDFATAAHLCCCGCGLEVVTPLSRTDWTLLYNGEAASLYPSVGNWSFPCQSHYWVDDGRVVWAGAWSRDQIERGRAFDHMAKQRRTSAPPPVAPPSAPAVPDSGWKRIKRWLRLY